MKRIEETCRDRNTKKGTEYDKRTHTHRVRERGKRERLGELLAGKEGRGKGVQGRNSLRGKA